ncbi:MAG TPA: hypothetical protein ENJ55_01665 [Rhizobiales bacterium]|nr:hypothetical protein [Hyphomicrobiales bacterium]
MLQAALFGPLLGLIEGPVFSIIDKLIPDPTLKAKLKAEIRTKTIDQQSQLVKAQRQILLEEIRTGSLLTRSWRPVLMYLIIVFLLVYGLLLPVIDLFTSSPVIFQPRWQDIPEGLWNLLGLGVGGYIGGRSLEKIAVSFAENSGKKPTVRHSGKRSGWHRRGNFS